MSGGHDLHALVGVFFSRAQDARERERERERECVCVHVFACMKGRHDLDALVCVFVSRAQDARERERVCVCVCVFACMKGKHDLDALVGVFFLRAHDLARYLATCIAAATRLQRRFRHPVPLCMSPAHPSPLRPLLTCPPPPSTHQCDAPMDGRHRGLSGTINARMASSPARCEDRENRSCTGNTFGEMHRGAA